MTQILCKNCENKYQGDFCNSCGQRNIGNHRLQMNEVIADFFDNTFNLHKGFFFTLYKLFISPGTVAKAYIDGKRKRYTNPTRFMVIGLAFQSFIDYWFKTTEVIEHEEYYYFSFLSEAMNSSMEIWNVKLAVEYILLSNLFMIILLPVLLYFLFKPLKYNYTELLSTSFYFFPAILFITMPFLFVTKVLLDIYVSKEVIIFIFTGYLFWSYLSFFKAMKWPQRFLRFTAVIGIFMFVRIAVLPWILSILYLQTS
ncbi:MAG: hypothetical protein CMB99_07515 [Flavobacteriaceae bacterium]|nr:hypothetical protein [Flavobacteriaceae bacterium]|tara:strand:+ start:96372 stop:97136 length:765 start_codon:yes stop_codon:yes gene_type:complete